MRGDMARLYNVFVDWEGRLNREMPGILERLGRAGAKRVLDAGCGTGRHVQALLKEGFDALGADISEDMLAQAREAAGAERIHPWRMGDRPSAELSRTRFDALLCLGNTWPQLTTDAEIRGAIDGFRRLLKRGGLLLMGLKAVAIRRETGDPYLPLLRREHEGEPLYFVRFVEFETDPKIAQLHMLVGRGDASSDETEALLHQATRIRVWSPHELEHTFGKAGFFNARVSGRIDDPNVAPTTEDVFLHAFSP